MKKHSLPATVALFCCLLSSLCTAQPFMNNIYGRQTRSLNGLWEAIVDVSDSGAARGIPDDFTSRQAGRFIEYSFGDHLRLHVPGDWNSQHPALRYYESSVWYRRPFTLEPQDGKRYFVYFGAANYHTDVYLNRQLLGSHEGGFTPFQFEITDRVQAGENVLIVRVNNRRSPLAIPAMRNDWWNYGGITGEVHIVETPSNYIHDYTIGLDAKDPSKLRVRVQMSDARAGEVVTVTIPEAGFSRRIITDTDGAAGFSAPARLTRWSPANPKLYAVEVGSSHETIREKIGFRNIEVKDNRILLNGEHVFLKGINCHDEIPQRMGRSFSMADARMLLAEVKALGCNFLRLTHYPATEHMVRLAEQMGIMLWEEVPLWQEIAFSAHGTLELANGMLSEMVQRDKNRCGIIIWSVANETRPGEDRNRVLGKMIRHCRSLDDSRLISAAFSHTQSSDTSLTLDDPVSALVDVIGVNKYYGWYIPWKTPPEKMVWNFVYEKPVIFSEFGSEALHGHHGDESVSWDWNEEYQARNYRDNLAMLPQIPHLAGLTPWVLFDFRSPHRLNGTYQQGWNRKGLISDRGHRKMAWYVLKEYYD